MSTLFGEMSANQVHKVHSFLAATAAQETTASKTPAELAYDVLTFSRKIQKG